MSNTVFLRKYHVYLNWKHDCIPRDWLEKRHGALVWMLDPSQRQNDQFSNHSMQSYQYDLPHDNLQSE